MLGYARRQLMPRLPAGLRYGAVELMRVARGHFQPRFQSTSGAILQSQNAA
jgi:hypothetical protein